LHGEVLAMNERMKQDYLANRTVFRIWNVKDAEWWSPNWRERTTSKVTARDLFFRRHTAEAQVAKCSNRASLEVVECDLVPRDPFYRELIERASGVKP
jgi:hypothetical protein